MSHAWHRPAHNGVLLLQSVATEIALLLALYGTSSLRGAHPHVEPKPGVHAALFVAHFQAICDFKYKRSSRILGFNFLIFDLPKLNYRTILSYSCPPTHRLSVCPHPPNLNLNNIHFPTYPHSRPHPPSSSSTLPLCHSATSLHLSASLCN